MAEWVLLENDQIVEYHDILPENWKNVSGLYKSSENLQFLNSLGWYKVEKQHSSWNPETQKLKGYEYFFDGNQVIEKNVIEEISQEDINSTKEYNFQMFLNLLRKERDQRLKDCDWTQLTDVIESNSDEFNYKWKVYRQKLRDITKDFSEPGNINWPSP